MSQQTPSHPVHTPGAFQSVPLWKYEQTAEFQLYLDSKRKWETAHAAYETTRNPITMNALTIAEWRMKKDLEAARRTPEHFAVWGY
jgi:hypothetical protein